VHPETRESEGRPFDVAQVIAESRVVITLQDDQVLRVYTTITDAIRDVEALDAEDVFRAVFDETGEVYAIKWIRPNTRGRFLRFLVGNGEYTLIPTGKRDVDGLVNLIRDMEHVEPAEARQMLGSLRSSLASSQG
jgi:hypothetical protein